MDGMGIDISIHQVEFLAPENTSTTTLHAFWSCPNAAALPAAVPALPAAGAVSGGKE